MRYLASIVSLLCCAAAALAGDWPQWLGPQRDGASPEKVAPWKEAPKVLWHHPVGEGHSAPVVTGGKVFVHASVKDAEAEEVIAYDVKTGNELWRTPYKRAKFNSIFGNGPRATPTVSGSHVYTLGVTGILSCFEVDGGKQVWQVDTLTQLGLKNLVFGMSCSPLVDSGKVYVNVGAKSGAIAAYDTAKGDVVWKKLDQPASYSSPILIGKDKERQLIFLTGDGLTSLDPADGTVFWQFPLHDKLFESSTTPVLSGDLLVGSSVTYGSACLRLVKKEKKPPFEEVWKNPELTCYFSTPVPVGQDYLYMVTGVATFGQAEATLRCVEVKSGKELWNKPKVGEYHASLVRTGDNKLLMLDDAGNLLLLDPNPKEYRELARSKVCDKTWVHPALADGRLYVRDRKEIICLQLGE